MRHALNLWTNPWRPAQDWFGFTPSDLFDSEDTIVDRALLPACEVNETKDQFVIALDMPGVTKEDISIEVQGSRLVIAAERKEDTNANRFVSERRYGRFERIFELGDKVDPSKVEASYQDGVLKVSLGKTESVKPRKVEIKTEIKDALSSPKPVN
ncbi:Hsp20/alpha crystallin family protein [bacterium]|nr:Hsp20/alpha crystallin family protein [bacterium]